MSLLSLGRRRKLLGPLHEVTLGPVRRVPQRLQHAKKQSDQGYFVVARPRGEGSRTALAPTSGTGA
jgi:hypothetical protein